MDPTVFRVAWLTLAGVFAVACLAKLGSLPEFEGVVRNHRLLPAGLVHPVARAVPLAEAAVAVGLLGAATRGAAAGGAVLLLVLFSSAVVVNLLRGRREIECGCFRGVRQALSWGLVGRNLLLVGLALACLEEPASDRGLRWLDGITVAAAATSLLGLQVAVAWLPARSDAPAIRGGTS